MTKPTTKHTDCTCRAEQLFRSGLNSVIEPKLRKALERDIRLISEIREMLFQFIENPSLPFAEVTSDPSPGLVPIPSEPHKQLLDDFEDSPDSDW